MKKCKKCLRYTDKLRLRTGRSQSMRTTTACSVQQHSYQHVNVKLLSFFRVFYRFGRKKFIARSLWARQIFIFISLFLIFLKLPLARAPCGRPRECRAGGGRYGPALSSTVQPLCRYDSPGFINATESNYFIHTKDHLQ